MLKGLKLIIIIRGMREGFLYKTEQTRIVDQNLGVRIKQIQFSKDGVWGLWGEIC